MDHPFPTHRPTIRTASTVREIISDIKTLCSCSQSDRVAISERRDTEVSDPTVRDSLLRLVDGLALSVHNISVMSKDILPSESTNHLSSLDATWRKFVVDSSSPPPDVSILDAVDAAAASVIEAYRLDEKDGGSSSPSDSSASESDSSSEEEDSEEDSEEEEEEED